METNEKTWERPGAFNDEIISLSDQAWDEAAKEEERYYVQAEDESLRKVLDAERNTLMKVISGTVYVVTRSNTAGWVVFAGCVVWLCWVTFL